jgi:hypothetical protein
MANNMNEIWSRKYDLPLVLIIIALGLPCVMLGFMPHIDFFGIDWHLWLISGIYLGGTLTAIRFISSVLVKANSDISSDKQKPQVRDQAYAVSSELLIMGMSLLSIPWEKMVVTLDEGLFFISLRWGITLIIIGGVVLAFVQVKMGQPRK